MSTTTKPLHPLILAAAVAVLLFCGVGTAALMGWLPSSDSRDAQPLNSAASSEQLASLQAIAPPATAQPLAPLPQQQPQQLAVQPAPVAAPAPRPQPQPEPQYVAAPAPKVCNNCGVIEAIHEVNTRASGSGVGAAGGAVVGGLLGNQVGGGNGKTAMTVLGAAGGAFAGNKIEQNMKKVTVYQVRVRMNDGSTRNVEVSSSVPVGSRVIVEGNNLRMA